MRRLTVTFNPQSITGAGAATMTVAVPASAPGGSFTITVTGTSGGRVHAAAPVAVMVNGTGGPAGPEEIVLYAKDAQPVAGA